MKHRKLTISLLTFAAAAAFFWPRLAASAAGAAPEPQARRGRAQQRRPPARAARPRVDYSKFSHYTAAHRKDSCDSCHKSPSDNWAKVRGRDAAFPDVTDYPEHASCLNCHRRQFFSGARPVICSVCHTVVSPRAGERHAFANPAEPFARSAKAKTSPTQFALIFPHDVHQDVMARSPSPADGRGAPRFVRAAFAQDAPKKERPNSCSICHETYRQPGRPSVSTAPSGAQAPAGDAAALPDGLLKTTPTGHDSCFNCHWQDGGEKPFSSDCAGCHKLLPQGRVPAPPAGRDADPQLAARAGFTDPSFVRKLLRRESVTFAHDEENHRAIDCASCHTRIPAISTLDDSTLKVPILSCGGGSGCHISARPKKILNEEVDKKLADANFQCAKCHVNLGREKPPRSHLDAVGK
ncbi:MAG TPA: cytochrome c3 family protein [Pyrinomonadaceae bacterium]